MARLVDNATAEDLGKMVFWVGAYSSGGEEGLPE